MLPSMPKMESPPPPPPPPPAGFLLNEPVVGCTTGSLSKKPGTHTPRSVLYSTTYAGKSNSADGGRLTCVCSLTQQCTVFCSILASYVRCFVLGDVLGLCGSVPGIAAMCASFSAVELPFSS